MKLHRMVGRLSEQVRRGYSDLRVVVGDGRKEGKEIQDVRVVFNKDGEAVEIQFLTEFGTKHIT